MIARDRTAVLDNPPMPAAPHEVLEDLDDDENDECIYLDRPGDPAYIWRRGEDEYVLLEQTRCGSWLPYGRPVDADEAAHYIDQTTDSKHGRYEVRPQTEIPPGRHHTDH